MLVIKNEMNFKKYLLVLVFTFSAVAINHSISTFEIENTQHALFLGCGVKKSKGPCNDLGYRVISHQVKVFGLNIGDSWTTEEPC